MPLARPLEATPEEVRAVLSPLRNDFSIALAGAGNPFSIGAVIRVAHSYLAREVFVLGDSNWYPKGSMGMEKYETVVRLADTQALRAAVGRRPIWAVEREHSRRSVNAVGAFPTGVVFVLGSERFGVPEDLLAAADEVVGIPLYWVNNSLPVTVAAGIVMNEWARRRYAEGATL